MCGRDCMDTDAPKQQSRSSNGSGALAQLPASWFHLGHRDQLSAGPVGVVLNGQSFVGYWTESGRPVVLSGRCSHMGADLVRGVVKGDQLVCPLHGWEYGPDGACERIPSSESIPAFARQCGYPTQERGGHVFFFNRRQARFPLPFFDSIAPEELLPARSFELSVRTPWYFIAANGFDIQHFRMAHDRELMEPPQVTEVSPFARRVVARFAVTGDSLNDRLTAMIAGSTVTMEVTSWSGTIIIVKAKFKRTTSYGMLNVLPVDAEHSLGRVIVWVRRSRNAAARMFFDPFNAAIRRLFIRVFLRSDLPRITGLRYQPAKLIAADSVLSDYFAWLERISEPVPGEIYE
jgi:nitrite reductase/ring-hydroxylating ferredoxin subunit